MKNNFKVLLSIILLSSCHKKIIEKNNDYEGQWVGFSSWKSNHFTLDIESNSHLIYYRHMSGGGGDHVTGTARIGRKKIHVKAVDFEIISPPEKIDSIYINYCNCYSVWKMTLRSPRLYGNYEVVYYRE